jgi:Bacterial protein of unknown function (Gcw_chp)
VHKKKVLALASVSVLIAGHARAEVLANVGWMSDYYYRGIFQARSSAAVGIDWSQNGFYAGTWAADLDQGLEIDGFFGYAREIGDVSLRAGFTGYYYTQDFDDTYQELNLGAALGSVSLAVAFGEYGNFAAPATDYTWYALTLEKNGFHGRLATFGRDFEGSYLELGYSRRVAELDVGLTLIVADDRLVGESTESLVFSIGKSFEIGRSAESP